MCFLLLFLEKWQIIYVAVSVQPGKSGAGASRGEVSGTRPISVVIRYSFELNRVFLWGIYINWEGEGGGLEGEW